MQLFLWTMSQTLIYVYIYIYIISHNSWQRQQHFNMTVYGIWFPCSPPLFITPSVYLVFFLRSHVRCSSESVWYFAAVVNRSCSVHPPRFTAKMIPPFLMSVLKAHSSSLHVSFSSPVSPFPLLGVNSPVLFSLLSHPSVNSVSPVFPLSSHLS